MEANSAKKETMNVAIPAESADDPLSQIPSIRSMRDVKFGLAESQVSFKIPTNEDAACHVHKKHGQHSWQAKILSVIHAKWFQRQMLGLLLLDILILFTELFLMATYPHCSIIIRDGISCCPREGSTEARWLAEDSHHSDICEPPLEATDYEAGCDGHKWHGVHTLEDILFGITIAILSAMMMELFALMAAISPCVFFRHVWYTLDFFIIAISLALEASFKAIDDDQLATYVGALVLFRCWRFVRISHGLIEATAEVTAQKYEKIVKIAEELEDLMVEHERKMTASGHDDSDETDSVKEIRILSKELAEKLIATEDEDKDTVHLSNLTKSIQQVVHKSNHNGVEIDTNGNIDVDVPNDVGGGTVRSVYLVD